ncbi:hypothetical protein CBR_g49744 [Chara braunii]|uniref:Reverse transcriptase RNase H-like domain-containing protein n=1 Tax=Chara braunii TaxID=69332 RepID=A0A388M5V6_CHABU|nr:hypothetical protein CBR_g49744 [Chara braunii]|eukprot:GBG89895.1 hypothetical protein CBR_g49744 [Chara braunii]
MVETRSGKPTTPYTKAQEKQAAAVLKERKEKEVKKELIRQAKKLALQQEQAAKTKKLEEEMERLGKEEEEKMKEVKEEEVEEEEEKEEPLERRRTEERGEFSGTKEEESGLEKKIFEWQDDGNGYRPVEFMSAMMPSEKVATSTYERELYALRQALDHWKHYLLGRHFKVYSDHDTLRWLKTQAKMTPKLTRWAAELDQYDFELKPVKGNMATGKEPLSTDCRAELFESLHEATEGTFLRGGTGISFLRFVYQGGAKRVALEERNLVAHLAFLLEHKLVGASS